MGAGAGKPVEEPIEFLPSNTSITAQTKENLRVFIQHDPIDVKHVACFSKTAIPMSNDRERLTIKIQGAGVLRFGVTETDPMSQQEFPEDPIFEQEEGFGPGLEDRVLYYHDNSEMFCYGPEKDYMEFSPNRDKQSGSAYIYVMFLYGKPTVTVSYKEEVAEMTAFEGSNLLVHDNKSITVGNVKNLSIMRLQKQIKFGNIYHIQWNMSLSKEKFAGESPKFGYLRIGVMTGSLEDLAMYSVNEADKPDRPTCWLRESALSQYPYSGIIALSVYKNNLSHNLFLSSVGKSKLEQMPDGLALQPCYLFIEAASGEICVKQSPKLTVKQDLGTAYLVKDHDELPADTTIAKSKIENKVQNEVYHIQYGLNPRSFVVIFNKCFTTSDGVVFTKVFKNSEKIGKFDTIQVLYTDGQLEQHMIEDAFRRRQQTGGGEIRENGVRKGEHVERCWIVQYRDSEDARRVWLRRQMDIEGVRVHILPWYKELGETANFGNKPEIDDTYLVIDGIDQDKLRYVHDRSGERTNFDEFIKDEIPGTVVWQEKGEFDDDAVDEMKFTIECEASKISDYIQRARWKDMTKERVTQYFKESIIHEEVQLEKKSYEGAVKRLERSLEKIDNEDSKLMLIKNRQRSKLKIVTSKMHSEVLSEVFGDFSKDKQQANNKPVAIPKEHLDELQYRALEAECLIEGVGKECPNTRFKITDRGTIELKGPDNEVQTVKDKILDFAANHMNEIQEQLTEGKLKLLQNGPCKESLQKELQNAKLSHHFRVEGRYCRLWIYKQDHKDLEAKNKKFRSCLDKVIHERVLPVPENPQKGHLKDTVQRMMKSDLHIQIDENAETITITGITERDVKQAKEKLENSLKEIPVTSKTIVPSLDILEHFETWHEKYKKYHSNPYSIEFDSSDPDHRVPIKIKIKGTETTMKKLEDDFHRTTKDIKSFWFHVSKPWLAVHREKLVEIVKSFLKTHDTTIEIETAPSLVHKNISGVALQKDVGTTCLPICVDITTCRVDVIVVPVYTTDLTQIQSNLAKIVLRKGGKPLSDECDRCGEVTGSKPALVESGDLPCQRVMFVHLAPGKDVSHVGALESCLKTAQEAFFSSVMIPISAFCTEGNVESSLTEIIKAIGSFVSKNSKGTVREIGLSDMKVDMVKKVEKAINTTLGQQKSWFVFFHGNAIKDVMIEQGMTVNRPTSSRQEGQARPKSSVLWGRGGQRNRREPSPEDSNSNLDIYDDDGDDDDDDGDVSITSPQVLADFNGYHLPYNLDIHGKVKLKIIRGSIEDMNTDVIVNPTPHFPDIGGAISNALVEKGGPTIRDECKQHGKIQAGEVKATTAGNLNCKTLYHTIQPVDWNPNTGFDAVRVIVSHSLALAHENQMKSIAFPAIGTGASRFPADKVAEAMVKAAFEFADRVDDTTIREIVIVIFYRDNATIQVFEDTVPRLVHVAKPAERNEKKEKSQRRKTKDSRAHKAEKQMKKLMFLPSKRPDKHSEADDLMFFKLTMEGDIKTAVKDFEDVVGRTFVRKEVKYVLMKEEVKNKTQKEDVIHIIGENLTSEEVTQIQNIEKVHNVMVTIDAKGRVVVIEGLSESISDAEMALRVLLKLTIPTERRTKGMKEGIMEHVQWLFEDNGQFKEYDKVSNFDIHFGYLGQTDFEYRNDSEDKKYRVLIQTLEEHTVDDSTKKRRMILRQKVQQGIQIPETWSILGTDKDQELVTLDPNSSEFDEVKKKFVGDGCPFTGISNIKRIEDKYKFLQYKSKEKQIGKQNKGKINERLLWHGTDAATHLKILKNGFDRSFAGAHATVHGKGVYFASTSQYSNGYAPPDASGICRMFLTRVLVGESCPSDRNMTVLPERATVNNVKILYDSAVNDVRNPSIFVIFHDTQAYPEYLIEYT